MPYVNNQLKSIYRAKRLANVSLALSAFAALWFFLLFVVENTNLWVYGVLLPAPIALVSAIASLMIKKSDRAWWALIVALGYSGILIFIAYLLSHMCVIC
ncbi:hypothetical protein [Olivibacter jilunii]|uniref:hypothetical protein n=1 Tax=Olivibacter jilunii TaxID=985016 RepID=UPI003F174FAB